MHRGVRRLAAALLVSWSARAGAAEPPSIRLLRVDGLSFEVRYEGGGALRCAKPAARGPDCALFESLGPRLDETQWRDARRKAKEYFSGLVRSFGGIPRDRTGWNLASGAADDLGGVWELAFSVEAPPPGGRAAKIALRVKPRFFGYKVSRSGDGRFRAEPLADAREWERIREGLEMESGSFLDRLRY